MLAAAHSALAGRGLAGDLRAERALVALLTTPITKYDVYTALGECGALCMVRALPSFCECISVNL